MAHDLETQPRLRAVFSVALHSDQPLWELRGVVRGLLAGGFGEEALAGELTKFGLELRAAGQQDEEDIVLEVLDFLTGWCSPRLSLANAGDAA